MSMLQKLSDFLGKPSVPSGYRPGVTLAHVQRNLAGLGFEPKELGAGQFSLPNSDLKFEARERTHSEFLMYLVLTDFELSVPSRETGRARLALRHTGAFKRTGVVSKTLEGEPAQMQALHVALAGDEPLQQALRPLDFKRLQISRSDSTWLVTLEHMAASEVINRMPGFRRYIRLDDPQRHYLVAALKHLQRILCEH